MFTDMGHNQSIYVKAQLIFSTVKKTHYIKKKSCQNLENWSKQHKCMDVKIINSQWRMNALNWQVLLEFLNFIQFPKIQIFNGF